MSNRLLDRIQGPADVKSLNPEELPQLARDIRDEIIAVTAKNGGHVGPNLGVVELTIALHRTFNSPYDQIVFDVAHQGYVHKLLTGRGGKFFQNLRKTGGASGFLYRRESKHDLFGAGHAGTALSAALGMATARDLRSSEEHVIAVCGDAAFTCGVTLEALNNVASSTKRLIVILNDNEWSIAKNVGAIASYLNRISTNRTYNRLHNRLEAWFESFPIGAKINRVYRKWKRGTKDFFVESSLFEKFGLRYLGPVDGHNFDALQKNLNFAKHSDVPVLVHVLTKKGKGFGIATAHPEKFHGTSPFDPATGEGIKNASGMPPNLQDVFGNALVRFAKKDPKIIGITGAMRSGTGLAHLAKEVPAQFFDVGIAEEHAVLFAAGLAAKGFRPVCAIYSTFLQRAYDQVIHDVCLQNLPVLFCMDRAGLSPADGPTHHGLFDISYLRCVPNAIVMQPEHEDELVDMMYTSLRTPSPTFIRYPRGTGTGIRIKDMPTVLCIGQAEILRNGSNIVIWSLGPMVEEALTVAERLAREIGFSVGVVNARWIKPLDRKMLLQKAESTSLIVTLEDHVVAGGFGSAVLETLQAANCLTPVERIGWPDKFIEHGTNAETLRAAYGLSTDDIVRRIKNRVRHTGNAHAEVDV